MTPGRFRRTAEPVWDRLRVFLCSPEDPDMERVDLVEDLMFWHADAFIDRLEAALASATPTRGPAD